MKYISIFILASIFYSPPLFAGGWFFDTTISQLQYSVGADGVHIQYTGGTGENNPDGCEINSTFIIAHSSENPERGKAMLSGASIAFTAEKKVDLYLSGCIDGIGGKSYPKIHYFNVKK